MGLAFTKAICSKSSFRYCPARWIRPKVGSFNRSSLKREAPRFLERIRPSLILESPLKLSKCIVNFHRRHQNWLPNWQLKTRRRFKLLSKDGGAGKIRKMYTIITLPINWSEKQRRRSFAVLICSSFFYGPPPKEEDTKPPLCLILNIFCAEYAANTISSVYINLIKCCRIKKLKVTL